MIQVYQVHGNHRLERDVDGFSAPIVVEARRKFAGEKHAESSCKRQHTLVSGCRNRERLANHAGVSCVLEIRSYARGKPLGVKGIRITGLELHHRAIQFRFHIKRRVVRAGANHRRPLFIHVNSRAVLVEKHAGLAGILRVALEVKPFHDRIARRAIHDRQPAAG